ncbi:sensor histidine kinase [Kineococcus rubinsiae]|uniref:sensor histidine kinase n=1 Tax=Kineococcus rubinsiae TaxID=2609562 RepID=UPI00142F81D4|nr:HAMP domain-containing sensor histidine kinase [Kineococcus rubinsiae]
MTTAAVHAHAGTPFTVPDADGGDDWRVIIRSAADYPINVAVALPLSGTSQTVDDFQAVSLLGGAVLAAVAIRRSFRPLQSIERTASAIAAGDLTQRVPATAATTEVGRLSSAVNAMLSQIEQAFIARQRIDDQMRRFVADASHELRTPLTAIRGFAELYRLGAVSKADDVAHVMGRIEAESTRLGVLVEDLLTLARLEESQRQHKHEYQIVDLAVLASDAVHDARALAPQRSVRLMGLRDDTGPGPAPVLGQDGSLRQVLTNLLANAIHHTPPTTPIEVAVGTTETPTGAEAVVEVRDHGPGLTREQSEKVFERFYRVDDSRQRGTGGGSGLGLAIASTIIDHHEGSIRVVPTPSGGATFQLRFHAQDPPA